MNGRISVGDPVDVGSGAVFTIKEDFKLPGANSIVWRRHYASDSTADGWLGRGWTVPYFMRLERVVDGFLLHGEAGHTVLFPAPDGLPEGQLLRNHYASMELRQQGSDLTILHWHPGGTEIERYRFAITGAASMPLYSVENGAGQAIVLAYDASGRLARLHQTVEGRVVELRYDNRNLITEANLLISGGRRLLARFEYDTESRLVRSSDAVSTTAEYGYDAAGRMVAERNALGSTFWFRYDRAGRCVLSAGDGGNTARRLQYLAGGRRTRVTDSQGGVTEYVLNGAGQVVQQLSARGALRTHEYDAYGRLVKVSYADGAAVAYEFDERGDRVAVVNEDGTLTKMTFDEEHRLLTYSSPVGGKWLYERDARGGVVALTNAAGQRYASVRDERGLLTQWTTPGGRTVRLQYGPEMAWSEMRDQLGLIRRVECDALGYEVAYFDALGPVRRTQRDARGRPVQIDDFAGRTVMSWNARDELVERIGADGAVERREYDSFGRIVTYSNALKGQVRFEYDLENRLVAVVNRVGERLERTYDADGNVSSELSFDGRLERYDYDLRGNRTKILKADGRTVALHYDKSGRLTARKSSDGLVEEFEYDANGDVVAGRSPDASVEIERDLMGRIVAETLNGRRLAYSYDVDNNRISRQLGDDPEENVRLVFDVRSRATAVGDARGDWLRLAYDPIDRLVERSTAEGTSELLTYDGSRRLAQQRVVTANGTTHVSRQYEYGPGMLVAARTDARRGRSEFRYDPIFRLVQRTSQGVRAERYAYDDNGTLLATQRGARTAAAGGRTLRDGDRTFEYDANGCIRRIASPEGDLLLAYNVHGQVVSATLPDGRVARYGYDPFGRRVRKDVAGEVTEFVWQGAALAAELRDDRVTTSYLMMGLEPVAQWHGKRRHLPVVDRISGALHELVDEFGALVWSVTLDSYGNLLGQLGSGSSPLRFRGQYCDAETGLHYNFARTYDPRLCDFVAPDPIGLRGGANFYAYSRNPINWDDPFGLTCNKHRQEEGEGRMDQHFDEQGYDRISSGGRPRGIDAVYKARDPNQQPQYIIGEAKFGSSTLGDTRYSGQQMSDQWIDTGIGRPSANNEDRLTRAVGPQHAADIRASAYDNPGSVQKTIYHVPDFGDPGTAYPHGPYTVD